MTMGFPSLRHDHQLCVDRVLSRAELVCRQRNVRLTTQRKRVLEILAQEHAAIGAYDLLDRLAADGRKTAPIAVYRALDFLMDQGLVHRVASLNAYVACSHPAEDHHAQFLICRHCRRVGELEDAGVDQAIANAAQQAGFSVDVSVVEVAGECITCRKREGGL